MVIINEFLPNPIGKDTDGEWIKLFNNGNIAVNLSGWRIKDASSRVFIFSTTNKNIIASKETLTLDYKTTKISLNNNGETIFLYDKTDNLIDKAEYSGTAADGKVYIRAENGKFIPGGDDNIIEKESELMNAPISISQENFNSGIIINNNFHPLNFSIGIFIALVLSAFFIFISIELELFAKNNYDK